MTKPLATPRRRRLKGEARSSAILDQALAVLAEKGFAVGTRALAAELGFSQALLYRYYPSKEALIDAVLERLASGRWQPAWDALLADPSLALEARLTAFYTAYLNGSDRATMRLFMRANLDGHDVARRLGQALTGRILAPIVEGLRAASGLPCLAERPLAAAERELAMGLHGSMVFLAIRKHLYNYPLPDDLGPLVARQARVWLPGALAEIGRINAGDRDRS